MTEQALSGQIVDEINKICCLSEMFGGGSSDDECHFGFPARLGMSKILQEIAENLCGIENAVGKLEEA